MEPVGNNGIRGYSDSMSFVASQEFHYDGILPGCYRVYKTPNTSYGEFAVKISTLETIPGSNQLRLESGTNTFFSQDFPFEYTESSVLPLTLDLHLETATKYISGVVYDQFGAPAAEQMVQARKINDDDTETGIVNNSVAMVRTKADGSFRVAVGNTSGHYLVDAEGDGKNYLENRNIYTITKKFVTFTDSSEETAIRDLAVQKITPDTHAIGHVVDKEGHSVGLRNIIIFATREDNYSIGTYVYTDAQGNFSLNLAPGSYRVAPQLAKYDPERWVDYPAIFTNVVEGQTVDLGTMAPAEKEIFDDTEVKEFQRPSILSYGASQLLFKERSQKVKNVRFNETFNSKSLWNQDLSFRSSWVNGALTFSPPTQSLSLKATSVPSSAQVTSRVFTPRGMSISAVTIKPFISEGLDVPLTYSISPDLTSWLNITPGKAINIPSDWDTTNGLRWRVTTSSLTKKVVIKDLSIQYTATTPTAKPVITKVRTVRTGAKVKIMLTGKNFTKNSKLYLGTSVITTSFKSSKILEATITRTNFASRLREVTVVTPNLTIASTSTRVNPRTGDIKK
jgi:hypothetical protein